MTFCRYKERLILLTYWHPETSLLIHREGVLRCQEWVGLKA